MLADKHPFLAPETYEWGNPCVRPTQAAHTKCARGPGKLSYSMP